MTDPQTQIQQESNENSEERQPSLACRAALLLIRCYQLAISPHLAGCCRFVPSCSQYGMEAFRRYSFPKALKLTAKRLARCRPGGPYGYDPVP